MAMRQPSTGWHILDTGSIWLKEFAVELGRLVPVWNWTPEIRNFGWFENWERIDRVADPRLEMTRFPLQRGYARFPIAQMLPFGEKVAARIRAAAAVPDRSTLVCTAPFYAPVAERWPGPVIYYLTDMTAKYAGMNARQILGLDRRMCRVARAVCPNSARIAQYLTRDAGCESEKITVIPNATREENLLDRPLTTAVPAPADMADLPRPVAGVIGNLAMNMDWVFLEDAIAKTADVSWVFVGPTDMRIPEAAQSAARRRLMERGGRIRFVGGKPYGQLARYARAFDVAVLPYKKQEPTYSGSATRFYEHLAACRPMLATRGFHELLSKEPLLRLVDSGDELAAAMIALRRTGFQDGFEEVRWRASLEGTWQVRARDLVAASQPDRRKVA
jgi:glycosyltransferase involved in cell wall biosynthesis